MRSGPSIAETAIAHMFMPLLESVDRGLYDHLSAAGMILPTFARRWITCWFSQDVPQIASRIMDVLMASHPSNAHVYGRGCFDSKSKNHFQCPATVIPSQHFAQFAHAESCVLQWDSLIHAEEVIETAVSYMSI
jgi:hypothetical protein